jgi:indole-3-glycerol phosphate synthase
MGFLERVLEVKREEVKKAREREGYYEERLGELDPPLSFKKALSDCRTKIIAEVKKRSPSKGELKEVDPLEQARIYEKAGAAAVSVLTDRTFFGGSLEDLERVAKGVSLPVLRKDFIIDRIQILEARIAGASSVLLIVRILKPEELADLISYAHELSLTPLVEVFSLDEADLALGAGAEVIGINNRDLETLELDVSLSYELAPRIKEMGAPFVVAESGIEKREQILELMNRGVDAFLIGTALMRSGDPGSFLKELMGFSQCG